MCWARKGPQGSNPCLSEMAFSTVVIVALLGIIFFTLGRSSRLSGTVRAHPEEIQPSLPQFRKKHILMNKSEATFFRELQRQLPPEYHIFPKMRIADVIDAVDGPGFYRRRNHILPKHVDFVICNDTFHPLAGIEVNGGSHHRSDRIARDKLVSDIFAEAQVPLEFVTVGTDFSARITNIVASLPKS